MPPQRVSFRQERMIEVVGRIVRHAQFFDDPAGPNVSRNRRRHDFIQAQRLERIPDDCMRSFCRQPLSPILRRQTSTDFYARRVVRFKLRNLQANEPDKQAISPKLRWPKAESILPEMRFDSVQHGIALCLRKRPSKEYHHTSVSIHAGERLPFGVAPTAQGEALGGDSHWFTTRKLPQSWHSFSRFAWMNVILSSRRLLGGVSGMQQTLLRSHFELQLVLACRNESEPHHEFVLLLRYLPWL
jgi:hypothetical protein